jgi:CheY-like chemotaxis protein
MNTIQNNPTTHAMQPRHGYRPARILVVDDEASIVDILCLLLEDEGFEVWGATTGVEALRAVRHQHPDLIITDLMMPGMDGYELSRLARAVDPDVHIVMMSAVIDAGRARTFPFLPKPFDLSTVVEVVKERLQVS